MMGTIPEWLSAGGALGALVAAVFAAIISRRLYGVEAERDRAAMRREKREQASGVAAWCVYCPDEVEGGKNGILIHNSSDAPVYDVQVQSTYSPKGDADPVSQRPIILAILPPGEFIVRTHSIFHWTYPEERSFMSGLIRPITKNRGWMVRSIRFSDAHGVVWERREGRLAEISHAESESESGKQSAGVSVQSDFISPLPGASAVKSTKFGRAIKRDTAAQETKRRMRELGLR